MSKAVEKLVAGAIAGKRMAPDVARRIQTVTIEPDVSQMTEEERVIASDACGDVRDTVRDLHNNVIGMARAIERPNHMLSRKRIEQYARQAEKALVKLAPALSKLPAMCAIVACLALSGCNCECEREGEVCERKCVVKAEAHDAPSRLRLQAGGTPAPQTQGVNGCKTGQCPIKAK